MNQEARRLGLEPGMSRLQAESFPVLVLRRDRPQEDLSFAELVRCAGRFSPRMETIAAPREESCGATLLLDVSGSERLLGSARQIAMSLGKRNLDENDGIVREVARACGKRTMNSAT
jgi:hypothetical protein